MLNEPPDHQRRVHPLERQPDPVSETQQAQPEQRVMLHIPVVQPYITYLLIAINVLVFVVGEFNPSMGSAFVENGANNQVLVLADGEYLRLLYAMFLHAGFAHVFFNMYALFAIGASVERMFGHVRFGLIYLLGGLTGSILSVVLNGPRIYSVGASGAVFAIFGAQIIYLYQHRKLLGENGWRELRSLLFYAGLNLLIGLTSALSPGGVNIDNWGHIGGLAGGVILTWFTGPVFLLRQHPRHDGAFLAEDANPLRRSYQVYFLFTAALLAMLIAATLIIGG